MRVKCTCGAWHNISPTGLAIVIDAFQDGDLTRTGNGGHTECILHAFDDQVRIAEFKRRYKGNMITVDSVKK